MSPEYFSQLDDFKIIHNGEETKISLLNEYLSTHTTALVDKKTEYSIIIKNINNYLDEQLKADLTLLQSNFQVFIEKKQALSKVQQKVANLNQVAFITSLAIPVLFISFPLSLFTLSGMALCALTATGALVTRKTINLKPLQLEFAAITALFFQQATSTMNRVQQEIATNKAELEREKWASFDQRMAAASLDAKQMLNEASQRLTVLR